MGLRRHGQELLRKAPGATPRAAGHLSADAKGSAHKRGLSSDETTGTDVIVRPQGQPEVHPGDDPIRAMFSRHSCRPRETTVHGVREVVRS